MRDIGFSVLLLVGVSACSETPVEEQSTVEMAETEKQVEEDAQSLEEAADEAVEILEAELDAELVNEGFGEPSPDPEQNQPAQQ